MERNIFKGYQPRNVLKKMQKSRYLSKVEENLKEKAIKEQENLASFEASQKQKAIQTMKERENLARFEASQKTLRNKFANREKYIINQSRKRRQQKVMRKERILQREELARQELARQESIAQKKQSNEQFNKFVKTLYSIPSVQARMKEMQAEHNYTQRAERGEVGCFESFVHGVKKIICGRRRGGTRSKRSQRNRKTRKVRK
jgi:hypothetical protein